MAPLIDGVLDLPVGDVDKQCHLLGPTALVVQALMGVIVLGSLLYKRHRERPRRAWNIWVFDVSKQVVGQAILHGSNVLISTIEGSRTLKNPCVTYFLNILLDTTIGVGLIYGLLHFFTFILENKFKTEGVKSGLYGDPPSIEWWAKQAAVYVLALTIMKSIMGAISLNAWLNDFGKWLLHWSKDRAALQVIFVMGLFPITMNVLQFWLIDSIVKFKGVLIRGEIDENPSDREPYTDNTSDLGPDADENADKSDIENGELHHRSSANPSRLPDGIPIRLPNESSFSTPASPTSSRTITAGNVYRRSPPPSPSVSSVQSATGSNGASPQFAGSSRCSEESDVPSALGRDGDIALVATSPSDGRGVPTKWESWKMTSPPSKA